jgi:3-phenylpropionate/cinnamic acid dioxygenase small subunit
MINISNNIELQQAAQEFLYHEARLLDGRKWRDWQKLFDENALYWIPASLEDYDPHRHVSIVFDDPAMLDDRIRRLESGQAYAQEPPSRTLHQVNNVTVERRDDVLFVRSNLLLCEFRPTSQRRMEQVGVFPAACEHELVGEPGAWRIRRKKVVLLQSDGTIADLSFLI